MMDAAEETTQLEKRPRVDVDALGHSLAQAATVAKVLDDDNLLREIIVRVGFPTTLVRAALVCKRWLGLASDPKFLSHFRKLHPPRLLGYYITERSVLNGQLHAPRFVPMLPQPPELTAVIRRLERYNFRAHTILHCRNGSIFTKRRSGAKRTHGVHRPLCAEKVIQIIRPLPPALDHNYYKFIAVFSKEEGSGLSYLYMLAGKSTAQVYMLQDGAWRMHTSASCLHGEHFGSNALLVDNKIYVPTASGDNIIVWDLTTSSFSTIQLPPGVKYRNFLSMFSRADDASSVYLIHVEKLQLAVWLHKGDNWFLVDTICLREMLDTLGKAGHILENERAYNVLITQVGDNGQFVFLQMCHCIFYLDIKCRTMCKVYKNTRLDTWASSIHPFMMIWPPTFPAIKDDPARKLSDG